MGVDFVCFDAEDYGVPQWSDAPDRGDSWALGAQYWSQNPHKQGYEATYGILLDMVGGQGAQFYQEGMSMQYAPMIVKKIHTAAKVVGFGSFFPEKSNGPITDDHVPVNTWHTVSDDMDHIDRNTLKAVGQTVVQVIFSE